MCTPYACGLGTRKGRGQSRPEEEVVGERAEDVPVGMLETVDSRTGALVRSSRSQSVNAAARMKKEPWELVGWGTGSGAQVGWRLHVATPSPFFQGCGAGRLRKFSRLFGSDRNSRRKGRGGASCAALLSTPLPPVPPPCPLARRLSGPGAWAGHWAVGPGGGGC